MKKKYIALTLILATSAAAFAGCADKKDNQSLPSETEQVSSESNNDNMTSQEPSSEDSENAKTEENKGIQNKNKGNESNAEINSNKGKINEKNSKDSKNNEKKLEKNSNINKNNNQNKNVSNTEFKKLSGKFICVDLPFLKTIPESERENARKELRNTYYDFKDDGTLIIGMNTPNGPIEFKGNFTQTKDKLVLSISIEDMNEKEESSYTFDGKTLKLTNPENLTIVFEKK